MTARQIPSFEVVHWTGRTSTSCVIIPVINEGERIGRLLAQMAQQRIPEIADIIIVDGGSTDGSLHLDRLQSLGVRGLLLKTGPGRLSAQLRCGYGFALDRGYDEIVTIDGNDKDAPDPIPAFIAALREGCDFVQASRFVPGAKEERTPWRRRLAIRLVHAPLLSLFSWHWWTDTTQGFRAYSRRLLEDCRIAVFRDVFQGYELLAYLSYRAPRLGYRCIELPSLRRYPRGEPAPTKITGLGELVVLKVLIQTCLGVYNPARPSRRERP